MYQQLKEKLWAYIVQNNPDLMFDLQEEYKVTQYLEEKVSAIMPKALKHLEDGKTGHAIHELCLNEMTAELKPSRYHYVRKMLAREFPKDYERLRESGLLTYETVNLVAFCKDTFDGHAFSEQTLKSKPLHDSIEIKISHYLNNITKIK